MREFTEPARDSILVGSSFLSQKEEECRFFRTSVPKNSNCLKNQALFTSKSWVLINPTDCRRDLEIQLQSRKVLLWEDG